MDGPLDAQKVDGSSRNVLQTCGNLMEGLANAQKAGGKSREYTES